MKKLELYLGAATAALIATPAFAQDDDADQGPSNVIIVTAQRQAESLQEVPIAVSAFDAAALEAQQIENSSDLQLTLPNITFTKTNFTSSSFTIRGIGDLCVGVSCDQATAIHQNESPLFSTRLFETEFFDLERVEVLRGPQGTLFGRNATSGVVNVVTAKPRLGEFEASADGEYGNYNSIKAKGMVNVPLGETAAVRLAGVYLNRDGYTKNLYDGAHYDDRDLYSIRGSLRWEPDADTTVDIVGSYFRENDSRMRIQKQLCQRDPTGVLGCLNNRRDYAPQNSNSNFTGTLTSYEFLATQVDTSQIAFAALGLGSLYGPEPYTNTTIPNDPRVVNTGFKPQYFTDELIIQGEIKRNFGAITAQISGTYQDVSVDAMQDYNLNVGDRSVYATGLNTLAFLAANGIPTGVANPPFVPGSSAYFSSWAAGVMPNGPTGDLCTSLPDESGFGSYGGNRICSSDPLQFDRSNQDNSSWTTEAIVSSDFDGPFNFLLGGIYGKYHLTENSYYVQAFPIDYLSGLIGALQSIGRGIEPSFLGTPFYRNWTDDLKVTSYGIFGEAYVQATDRLKLTVGLRYNNDKKTVRARQTLASFLVPYGTQGDIFNSPYVGSYDGDPALSSPGNQLFQIKDASFDEVTGRAVIDYEISPDNLIYASYSRGYKSGGVNPPVQAIVPETFEPELIDAFEIGSKNTFADGKLQLNATAFYYKYKGLQLSKIVQRTSVNENIDANIWGVELEGIIRPSPDFVINMGASYLHTEVAGDTFSANPRDFGGGRSDAVIIKDLGRANNCAVAAGTPGNVAGVNAFVNFVNNTLNSSVVVPVSATYPTGLAPRTGGAAANPFPLQGTTPFPADSGIASTGAFSYCGYIEAFAAAAGANFDPNGLQYFAAGIPVNIKGNKLPQAPNLKFSAGAQYTHLLKNDMTVVPRVDVIYTGESYGNIFNGNVNRMESYVQVNAQLQLNSADERWYVRGFVQNLFDSSPVTGLYVTDQVSGLYSNVFTLEPRRYGIGAGFKF